MEDRTEVQQRLATTPFVASWIGRARPGELHDADQDRRAAAWASWAFSNVGAMTGNSDRPYVALSLPGRFYDPKGTGPAMRPHLEIPGFLIERAAPDFPDRLAQIGNGLLFPWWLVPEVLAVKRALFGGGRPLVDLPGVLYASRTELEASLVELSDAANRNWSLFEGLLVAEPERMSSIATAPFSASEVADFFPAARALGIEAVFDEKLRASSRGYASRRVGVWRLVTPSTKASLGVVTPRLTRSSLFSDPLFRPERESAAALLVRGLVLRRLLRSEVDGELHSVVLSPLETKGVTPRLRAIVAKVGEKLPEASMESAIYFLQTHPDPAEAWRALTAWAEAKPASDVARRAIPTVSEAAFREAHAAALKALRRAEEPERADVNQLLPLAWDWKNQVVRVTFSRPASDDSDTFA